MTCFSPCVECSGVDIRKLWLVGAKAFDDICFENLGGEGEMVADRSQHDGIDQLSVTQFFGDGPGIESMYFDSRCCQFANGIDGIVV